MSLALDLDDVLIIRNGYSGPQGTKAFNVLHYQFRSATPLSGSPPFQQADLEVVAPLLAQEAFTFLNTAWKQGASNQVAAVDTMVQKVWPGAKSRQYTAIPNAPVQGEADGDCMPLQDSAVIVKRTAFGARWGVGRVFVVGMPENNQDAGVYDIAYRSYLQVFANRLRDDIVLAAQGYSMVFRPVLFGPNPAGGKRINELESCTTVDNIVKTQRRRRPGKGM